MVVGAWADPGTDPEARDPASAWAVVEGQAAQELAAEEPARAAALARQEVAAGVPAYGSQEARAVLAARAVVGLVGLVVEQELAGRGVAVELEAEAE